MHLLIWLMPLELILLYLMGQQWSAQRVAKFACDLGKLCRPIVQCGAKSYLGLQLAQVPCASPVVLQTCGKACLHLFQVGRTSAKLSVLALKSQIQGRRGYICAGQGSPGQGVRVDWWQKKFFVGGGRQSGRQIGPKIGWDWLRQFRGEGWNWQQQVLVLSLAQIALLRLLGFASTKSVAQIQVTMQGHVT